MVAVELSIGPCSIHLSTHAFASVLLTSSPKG
jgi:hypothetical protein